MFPTLLAANSTITVTTTQSTIIAVSFDSSTTEIVIATIAAVGFALLLGIPAILAAARPILERQANSTPKNSQDYLITQLSKEGTVNSFLYISVVFLISGILDVIGLMFPNGLLLGVSWSALIAALALTIIRALSLLFDVSYFLPRARREFGGFRDEVEKKSPRKQHEYKCPTCQRVFKSYKEIVEHMEDCIKEAVAKSKNNSQAQGNGVTVNVEKQSPS